MVPFGAFIFHLSFRCVVAVSAGLHRPSHPSCFRCFLGLFRSVHGSTSPKKNLNKPKSTNLMLFRSFRYSIIVKSVSLYRVLVLFLSVCVLSLCVVVSVGFYVLPSPRAFSCFRCFWCFFVLPWFHQPHKSPKCTNLLLFRSFCHSVIVASCRPHRAFPLSCLRCFSVLLVVLGNFQLWPWFHQSEKALKSTNMLRIE